MDQTSQIAENLAPGTQLLGEPTTNEQGQTVQRTVDDQGNIIVETVDEEGNPVSEEIVGNVTDLPGAEGTEWSTNEQGQTTRTVKDESGTLISLQLGPDGSLLNLQIPLPPRPRRPSRSPAPPRAADPNSRVKKANSRAEVRRKPRDR